MVYYSHNAHYRLTASIDLSGIHWSTAVIPSFEGNFDGNNLTVSHLTIAGNSYLGLFSQLGSEAEVKDLGIVDVNIIGSGGVGGLVAYNEGNIIRCYSTGLLKGSSSVGGLVGQMAYGSIECCYSVCSVSGEVSVGGLVGTAGHCYDEGCAGGLIKECCSAGPVAGDSSVGGLVGFNYGTVTQCYSTGAINGKSYVGGLVGCNDYGSVAQCYSTGEVDGNDLVGGLIGKTEWLEVVTDCFWDIQTSGQTTSAGGTSKTTAEMQTAKTFLEAGWDFVGETANGTEDIWWILEGLEYPRLWWEKAEQQN
jgi:hypothetical protein